MLQNHQVLSFFRPRENSGDWTQRELAEFYRVEEALVNSGVSISTDRGVSDEGEPWFVFYRQDNEEVIVHFARIDNEYVVASNLTEGVVRGRNFQTLVRELLDSHPYVLPKSHPRSHKVYLHPATLLAALVATGFIKSTDLSNAPDDAGPSEKSLGWAFSRHDLVAYSAIVIAAVWDSLTADPAHKFVDLAWFDDVKADHDVASLPVTEADDSLVFNISVLDHSHDNTLAAASTTLNFDEAASPKSAAGWVPGDVKALGHQSASSHSGDSELSVSAHDVIRLEKDGDWRSAASHLDHDGGDTSLADGQKGLTVALAKSGGSLTPAAVPAAVDSHASSDTSLSSTTFAPVSASSVLISALHIDSQALHPIALAATNLTEAIQATFQELNQENSSLGVTSNQFAAVGSGAAASQTSSSGPMPTAPLLFDTQAQQALTYFIDHTKTYEVESFGRDLLIVDKDLSHFATSTVESWAMADGSVLSIVGVMANHPAGLAA